jgi:hypothetical protein
LMVALVPLRCCLSSFLLACCVLTFFLADAARGAERLERLRIIFTLFSNLLSYLNPPSLASDFHARGVLSVLGSNHTQCADMARELSLRVRFRFKVIFLLVP